MGLEMIEAEIVCDSLAPSGVRLTTFVLTYPRFIHAEFMTHRVFSRNASSSRAIPVKKSIQMVRDNPVIPLAFTKNQKGMQGGEALAPELHDMAVAAWLDGRDRAVEIAERLADLEVHKQYANRVLEPYAHITVVCTATDWNNFFALRCHPDAQPEIQELANKMYDAMQASKPVEPKLDLHVPFIDYDAWQECGEAARKEYPDDSWMAIHAAKCLALKRSVARCARVSYLNHDGTKTSIEQDVNLFIKLVGSHPMHASPAEHQAWPTKADERSGNFRGWIQYRKTLHNENVMEFKVKNESK